MSGDPLLCFIRDSQHCLEVIETKRGSVAPGVGLILERPGEGRCEEWAFLTTMLAMFAFVASECTLHGIEKRAHNTLGERKNVWITSWQFRPSQAYLERFF